MVRAPPGRRLGSHGSAATGRDGRVEESADGVVVVVVAERGRDCTGGTALLSLSW